MLSLPSTFFGYSILVSYLPKLILFLVRFDVLGFFLSRGSLVVYYLFKVNNVDMYFRFGGFVRRMASGWKLDGFTS